MQHLNQKEINKMISYFKRLYKLRKEDAEDAVYKALEQVLRLKPAMLGDYSYVSAAANNNCKKNFDYLQRFQMSCFPGKENEKFYTMDADERLLVNQLKSYANSEKCKLSEHQRATFNRFLEDETSGDKDRYTYHAALNKIKKGFDV